MRPRNYTNCFTFALMGVLALSLLAPRTQGQTMELQNFTVNNKKQGPGKRDIVDEAVHSGTFTTLVAAVKAADLVETLKGEGPFTVFAPNDKAFAKLPEGTVETLLKPENRGKLRAILKYHVVPGRVTGTQAQKLDAAKTLLGQRLSLGASDRAKLTVDQARVTTADVMCSNGVIHVVDSVLMPTDKPLTQTLSEGGRFGTLLAAAEAAGLVETLAGAGPFTVLAPTDTAFDRIAPNQLQALLKPENREKLKTILLYHVIPGRVYADAVLSSGQLSTAAEGSRSVSARQTDNGVFLGGAKLLKADVEASNGVVHVIDTVLMPSPSKTQAMRMLGRRMITMAIKRGAPMYNAGHHKACAELYVQTAGKLLEHGPRMGLNAEDREQLSQQIDRAQALMGQDADEAAWVMRRALDRTMARLSR